jgi:hypothetical protein
MSELSNVDRQSLINAIANREGTARELAKWYGISTAELRAFLEQNREAVEMARTALDVAQEDSSNDLDVSPRDLAELWITNKGERLNRYEIVADYLLKEIMRQRLSGADLSTALREFRSYAIAAANELGQLLHRGAGEGAGGDTMSVDIQGISVENLQ